MKKINAYIILEILGILLMAGGFVEAFINGVWFNLVHMFLGIFIYYTARGRIKS